jgi:hypothetical protein
MLARTAPTGRGSAAAWRRGPRGIHRIVTDAWTTRSGRARAGSTGPGRTPRARPALLARYRSPREARRAIEALEDHGVDGNDIELVGESAVLAERAVERRSADRRVLRHTVPRIAAGIVVGAVAGALFGFVAVSAALVLWPGDVEQEGWVLALPVALCSVVTGILGAFFVVERRTGFSESWPLTLETAMNQPVWLAVYGDHEDAGDVIDDTEPLEVVIDLPG